MVTRREGSRKGGRRGEENKKSQACSQKLEEEKGRKRRGQRIRRKIIEGEWETGTTAEKSEEWKSADNRGEERKNQKRGGCGEVPRPATGSAVRMINGN